MSGLLSIQKLIFEVLNQNLELSNILGGLKIYDHVPNHSDLPYVVFGKFQSDDWSTDNEIGEEHQIELIAWSAKSGRKQVIEISSAIRTALLPLISGNFTQPSDYHISNFTFETASISRSKDNKYFKALLAFRAVSEPVNS